MDRSDMLALVEHFTNWQKTKEGSVSEDLEKAAWLYYDKNRLPIPPEWDLHKEFIDFFKAGAQWQKSKDEPSTEDLEEESKKYSSCIYLEEVLSDDDIEVLKEKLINTFKAGAKWQKEKEYTCYEEAFEDGAKWKKEEMMTKAIEGRCFSYKNGFVHISCDIDEYLTDIKLGDKVKLIPIKED
jgi:hypothetical protein